MNLLGTEKYRNELAEALNGASNEIIVLSAFATQKGLEWVFRNTPVGMIKGCIIVRWKPEDIISGASSLDVYPLARSVGWDVFVCSNLHAKTILIDRSIVFLGSANITGNGLLLSSEGNQELGVKIVPSDQDLNVIDSILSESTLITDKIFDDLKRFIEAQKLTISKKATVENWSKEIEKLFQAIPKKLWVVDLPWLSPEILLDSKKLLGNEDPAIVHDIRLFGFESLELINEDSLKCAFTQSRAWKWLLNIFREQAGSEVYFGTVTSKLHDALLDDPKPYRKNVKELVQNLFSWAEFLGKDRIEVDVPGRKSQRMRYLGL